MSIVSRSSNRRTRKERKRDQISPDLRDPAEREICGLLCVLAGRMLSPQRSGGIREYHSDRRRDPGDREQMIHMMRFKKSFLLPIYIFLAGQRHLAHDYPSFTRLPHLAHDYFWTKMRSNAETAGFPAKIGCFLLRSKKQSCERCQKSQENEGLSNLPGCKKKDAYFVSK